MIKLSLVNLLIFCFASIGYSHEEISLSNFPSQITFKFFTNVSGQKVYLATNISDWDAEQIPMSEVKRGVYEVTIPTPWITELHYKFVVNGSWHIDPNCSDKIADGLGGFNCRIWIGFAESRLLSSPVLKPWLVEETEIEGHHVAVLRPPFISQDVISTVYFQDGGDYLNRTNIQNFLTNYYEKTGVALLAVLVFPNDRTREYGDAKRNEYDEYLSQKLVPTIEKNYRTGGATSRRLLIGPSLGGLATLRQGLLTDKFGFVAPQSGSFWFVGKQLSTMISNRIFSPNIFLVYGYYEGSGIVDSNGELIKILTNEKLKFNYQVTPSQHDWYWWRNQLEPIFNWFILKNRQKKNE